MTALQALIEPSYATSECCSRPLMPAAAVLRIHPMQERCACEAKLGRSEVDLQRGWERHHVAWSFGCHARVLHGRLGGCS